jgi:putative transposase
VCERPQLRPRTIKYVYLHADASVSETHARISVYLSFYGCRRTHLSLDGKTLDQAYFVRPIPEAVVV